jgi:SAM-dependent methyltransferase
MNLTPPQFDAARAALLGPGSDDLIRLLFAIEMGKAGDRDDAARRQGIDLGWLNGEGTAFTPVGYSVADSIREYVFWLERQRRLHLEGQLPYLSEAYYAGKSVLEIGCGYGCNLIPIRRSAAAVTGLEPNLVYHQMSRIICEREGLEPLHIIHGQGETLPVRDGAFDLVLCVSTHQYTDVKRLLREASRALKPGGELQVVGGTLGGVGRMLLGALSAFSRRQIVSHTKSIANTLAYQTVGRRVLGQSSGATTGYPIYPSRRHMTGWLEDVGLVQMRPIDRAGSETVFSFRKT